MQTQQKVTAVHIQASASLGLIGATISAVWFEDSRPVVPAFGGLRTRKTNGSAMAR
jgi:hypothetical protein